MLPITTAEKYEVVLKEHLAMEDPPTFLFKCLTGVQQRDLLQLKEDLNKGDEIAKFNEMFATVESYLIGWENIDVEYGEGQLIEVINWDQCIWLMSSLVYQRPSVADKKKCKSESPLNGAESSAPTAQEVTSASESLRNIPAGDSTE